jgi:NAD(P)-dependent dehydrogenase (short-subunit alcohol dehydrogenase family)
VDGAEGGAVVHVEHRAGRVRALGALPEDVAAAVAFLCSQQSSWLTGEVLDLNGGAHLKRYPNIAEHLTRLMEQ